MAALAKEYNILFLQVNNTLCNIDLPENSVIKLSQRFCQREKNRSLLAHFTKKSEDKPWVFWIPPNSTAEGDTPNSYLTLSIHK